MRKGGEKESKRVEERGEGNQGERRMRKGGEKESERGEERRRGE